MTGESINARARRSVLSVAGVAILALAAGCLLRRASDGEMVNNALISESELDSVHAASALDAVRQLRPMFLISRGKLSLDPRAPPALPNVYVDNQFYGDASTLQMISVSTIDSIKFYSAADAQFKFGRGNQAGVIDIFTKH